jgi:hypothetical protein
MFIKKFDHYMSLGNNCEIAFNLRRVLHKDISYYFNWLVTPIDGLIGILSSDFKDHFNKENLLYKGNPTQYEMITDTLYNLDHHSPFKKIKDFDFNSQEADSTYIEHLEKLELFKQRFHALQKSNLEVLYIIKTASHIDLNKINIIYNLLLTKNKFHKFSIAWIIDGGDFKVENTLQKDIYRVSFPKFADFNRVESSSDHATWDLFFQAFPLKDEALLEAIQIR